MLKFKFNLHLFEGDGAGAAAGAGEGGGEAAVTPGMLDDGTEVDNRLAARLEQQAKRRKARGEQEVVLPAQQGVQAEEPKEAEPEKSLDEEWTELRKGKFKDQYSRDVQNAIQDRFKNQKNATDELEKLQPMLTALEKLHGIDEGDTDTLIKTILDDDSLYEDAADEAGMTVENYKAFQQVLAENERLKRQEQESQEEFEFRQHFNDLYAQAEELKKTYPNFDLLEELKDPNFRRLTDKNSGLSVEAAYFALHHKELEPQAMAYGIERAKKQISQTIQANRQRPSEGAMQRNQQAEVHVNPRAWDRDTRQKLIQRAARGEEIVF